MRRWFTPARTALVGLLPALVLASACAADPDADPAPRAATTQRTTSTTEPPTSESTTTETTEPDPFMRPAWLGSRPLPLRPDGLGVPQPTPPELTDRGLATPTHLPPPPDNGFHHTISAVPEDVAARSTWRPECPVGLDELRYVTVSFWGFDGGHHTGDLMVHASAAEDIVEVFSRLHRARFPIEELRVMTAEELHAHPTGDDNLSGVFECRPAVQSDSWSEHARGLAVNINPFHNPYVRGDAIRPELASAYLDRDNVRPGMITPGDVVTRAFADVGWHWGGNWNTLKDWMHFSPSGR